jgi:enoyl-CoA hydratase/carnithine racemase
MTHTKIRYTSGDGVATIELNDPPANTYSYEMMREIDGAVLDARMDRAVHVIVLRGAGEKFFCAGANIGMLKEADPEFNAKQFTPPNKASRAVGRIKRAVQSGLEMSFGDGLALERELQQLLFESRDAREGISANIDKRKPNFSGS